MRAFHALFEFADANVATALATLAATLSPTFDAK